MPPPTAALPRLIVNADDFGQQPARDAAILDLYAAGAVSSASLVVNGRSAGDACRRANEHALPLGLHLNLGDGPALTGRSPLTDATGHFLGKAGLRAALDRNDIPATVLDHEIAAQLARFIHLAGRPPSHIDGHHHCHVAPAVVASLVRCLDRPGEKRPAVRLPRLTPALESAAELDTRFAAEPAILAFHRRVQHEAQDAAARFAAHRLRTPVGFFGIALMGRGMSVAALHDRLARLRRQPPGIYELMCHPGYPAADGDAFATSPERQQEFDVLQAVFGHRCSGLELTDFSALPPAP